MVSFNHIQHLLSATPKQGASCTQVITQNGPFRWAPLFLHSHKSEAEEMDLAPLNTTTKRERWSPLRSTDLGEKGSPGWGSYPGKERDGGEAWRVLQSLWYPQGPWDCFLTSSCAHWVRLRGFHSTWKGLTSGPSCCSLGESKGASCMLGGGVFLCAQYGLATMPKWGAAEVKPCTQRSFQISLSELSFQPRRASAQGSCSIVPPGEWGWAWSPP